MKLRLTLVISRKFFLELLSNSLCKSIADYTKFKRKDDWKTSGRVPDSIHNERWETLNQRVREQELWWVILLCDFCWNLFQEHKRICFTVVKERVAKIILYHTVYCGSLLKWVILILPNSSLWEICKWADIVVPQRPLPKHIPEKIFYPTLINKIICQIHTCIFEEASSAVFKAITAYLKRWTEKSSSAFSSFCAFRLSAVKQRG